MVVPSLVLAPSWRDDRLLLVRAVDAIRLCRDGGDDGGYEALSAGHLAPRIEDLRRYAIADVRQFIAQVNLTRFPLSTFSDQALLTLLQVALKAGELVVLRQTEGEARIDRPLVALRRLVRQIEALSHRRLSHGGRQYKLAADQDLGNLPDRDRYEVARREDAAKVLTELAKQGQHDSRLPSLLVEAKEKLSRDWRPPFGPEGLVLLRRIPMSTVQPQDTGAAITPSQVKQMLAGWVELFVVWDDTGQPISGVSLTAESGGATQSLTTDGSGRIRVEGVEEACEISCSLGDVTVDECVTVVGVGVEPVAKKETKKETQGEGGAAPLTIVDIVEHKVASGETLDSIAAAAGIDATKVAKFNWGTDAAEEINQHLFDEVGCTKKSMDGRNYLLVAAQTG